MTTFLIVGLGNPGREYEHNRHNVGFLAVDRVAGKLGAGAWGKKFGSAICEIQGSGVRDQDSDKKSLIPAPRSPIPKTYFLKPQTFMNLSGDAVAAAAGFYKIPPERIIVLHDDLDLLPGRLRVKQAGGSGGHNGIKSIDAHIGKDYWRVRIGIGHPGDKDLVSPYVLSDFPREEWTIQEKMIEAVAAHFPLMLAGDAAGFMNKVALEMGDQGSGIRDQ
jgi:PTH1 family peptidyl-tRNA hydrolase